MDELVPIKPSSKDVSERMMRTYVGAFVLEPKPGLYKNIMVFDFRSLYPSIIVSHNISPDTLNCSCCKKGHESPDIDGKRYSFCKKKKGIMAQFLEELITRRAGVKNLLKKTKKGTSEYITLRARSEALKLVALAYYGYLGFAAARWYSLECAEATTAFGRKYITDTISSAKKEFDVIYGDTDSIAVALGEKNKDDAMKFIDGINKHLPGVMQLEIEGLYPRGIFVSIKSEKTGAKKKYAMINEEGEIIVRGFEYVRRDWSIIAKRTQMAVFEAILREDNKERALNILQDAIKALRENTVPLEDVAILTQLKKEIGRYESIGPHVAAAIRGKARGFYTEPGAIIKYVVCRGPGSISERSHMMQIVKEQNLQYDPEYYINNQVLPAVERILKTVGFTEKEILQTEQTELGKYF
jgi:DNA polymerase Pol2